MSAACSARRDAESFRQLHGKKRGKKSRRSLRPVSFSQTVKDTLGYVLHNRTRMDYARYRRLGLPTSSAPVESTIKQINRRVKGTEKFWLDGGAEAILQLRAAYLSEDDRASTYWSRPRPYARAGGGRLRVAAA